MGNPYRTCQHPFVADIFGGIGSYEMSDIDFAILKVCRKQGIAGSLPQLKLPMAGKPHPPLAPLDLN